MRCRRCSCLGATWLGVLDDCSNVLGLNHDRVNASRSRRLGFGMIGLRC